MRHAPVYCNVKNIFGGEHPVIARGICEDLAAPYRFLGVDAVVGPASGAIPIAQGVAAYLSALESRSISAITAHKCVREGEPRFHFSPDDAAYLEGRKILLVEDVITTAESLAFVSGLVNDLGGEVVGIAVVVDRSGESGITLATKLGGAVYNLLRVRITTWADEQMCLLCGSGVPVDQEIGRGRVFSVMQHR